VQQIRHDQLDRDVALKILPSWLLDDEAARKRFRTEALALAKLNHSNIATVFEFGESQGIHFLAMEYVAGVSLAERVTAGPMPEPEVLALGMQMASALEEAEAQGIVHRDLKPQNVMLTPKGQAKVLDFGLAKLVKTASEETLDSLTGISASGTGVIVGTLPYMSPEQLRGQPADARSDLWALGTVLYEMATGRRAFPEKVATALAADIQYSAPIPPRELNGTISNGLEQLIRRCLERDPGKRFQSARELLDALKSIDLAGGRANVQHVTLRRRHRLRKTRRRIESLVVLPLTNLTRDPEQEYFADGMTDALISNLAKVRALKIISRTSAMRYKGISKTVPEIAGELRVDAVVEGSVMRAGSRVRITAQLIHGATDTPVWTDSYERDLQDVLLLQSELARAITGEIQVAITPEEKKGLARARTVNPEAYEAYLKGRFHWYKLSRDHLDKALEYLELAREKDPNYALAHSQIAYVWLSRADIGLISPHEAFPIAKTEALKALDLDDTLAEVHEVLAGVKLLYEWDREGAEKEFRRAIELNPNYADVHMMYADFLISSGRVEEWKAEIGRCLQLDPLNFFFQCFQGWHLLYLGRYDEAIRQLRVILRTEPDFPAAHLALWGAFYRKGMYKEALEEARTFFTLLGDREVTEALQVAADGAEYAAAMRAAGQKLAARSKETYVPALRVARMYAHAGEKDCALLWLEKAAAQHESPLCHLQVGWDWAILHDEPRFQSLVRRLNFGA
jgi:serine/threonine-protein kinase